MRWLTNNAAVPEKNVCEEIILSLINRHLGKLDLASPKSLACKPIFLSFPYQKTIESEGEWLSREREISRE